MIPDIYSASDYAGLSSKNLTAYYGYEVTDENDEWCFEAKFNNEIIKIPSSKLGVKDKFDCTECLLRGISLVMMKYKLTP